MTTAIPKEAFTSGLLDKDFHERLLGDIEQIIQTAGVPDYAVWSRLSEYCTAEEFDWVRNWRSLPDSGLAFVGKHFPIPVEDKMMAITGACLRNYIDARMMPLQELVRRLKANTLGTPTMLLIPNFCLDKDSGGDMPVWEVSHLMGLLLQRNTRKLKTVLYISSMASLEKQYGTTFRKYIEGKYSVVTPDQGGAE